MKVSSYRLRRQIAGCLVFLMSGPLAEVAAAMPQQGLSSRQTENATVSGTQLQDSQSTPQAAQPNTSQAPSDQQQNGSAQPVGTAAAPLEKPSGVAASRPAGAVIAPAKQRRARAILIRVGIVVGAAVAIGTVVALSKGSPSRPN
jgi:hypothetical protein